MIWVEYDIQMQEREEGVRQLLSRLFKNGAIITIALPVEAIGMPGGARVDNYARTSGSRAPPLKDE